MSTTLLDADGNPKYTNRLAREASPYLRQHAHNPVDWYPWGSEAFEKAAAEDKPVFLSIGYSTCHWCHVMERESFDNEEIAAYLNAHFVSIKLDREQRPDLDDIYMTGVQMMTGQGGWPMSSFLTAEGKPFYAGTYFPAANFMQLLQQIDDVWHNRRTDVLGQADEIASGIARFTAAKAEAKALDDDLAGRASAELLGRFDAVNGGFGGAPKFPNESMLLVLLDDWQRNGNEASLDALRLSLDKMAQGGIYDQVGGGFHRYTVDAVWLVPHFEKMLYNQSQLVSVYVKAWHETGERAWRRVVEQTLDYVLRDMTSPDGGFYSATDADSEGEEGRFFLWTPDELASALGEDDAALVTSLYGVSATGNFEGSNILNLDGSLADYAAAHDMKLTELENRIDDIRMRLYAARETREHPLRDEKIITAWNGMMISSFAEAGYLLARNDYLDAAMRAANYLWQHAWQGDGRLWRINFENRPSIPGNLEDYACFAEALLDLYRYSGDREWLDRGRKVIDAMVEDFYDSAEGGFFLSRAEEEGPLISRPKSPMDGATPSANSVALACLVQLYAMTGDTDVEAMINASLGAFAGLVAASPSAFSYMIGAAGQYLRGQSGRVQFAGDGNLRVACVKTSEGDRLDIRLAPGWHINAEDVGDENLVPTRVEVQGEGVEVVMPKAAGRRYESSLTIDITGDAKGIAITLQPCNDDLCLAPETLQFR